MPQLGSQFENTYTVEPGKTVSKVVKEKKDPESVVTQIEKRQAENRGKPFRDFDYVKEEVETPDTVTDYDVTEHPQGMLFAPETGTFRPGDPLYPREQRLADVKKNYPVSIKGSTPKSKIEEVQNMIANTSYSKQELEQGAADIRIETTRGYAGSYDSSVNRIYLRDDASLSADLESSIFSHELGHAFDSKLRITRGPKREREQDVMMEKKGRFTISPTEEGIADGMGDRYGHVTTETPEWYKPEVTTEPTMSENERRLHPSHPDRRIDMKSYGYSTQNDAWSNKQEQALYAATRLHVGMHGPKGIADMPDMNELVHKHLHEEGTKWVKNKREENEREFWGDRGFDRPDAPKKVHDYDYLKTPTFKNQARALFLGKLLHENTAVHESMHSLGFGEIATHAVDTYKYHEAVHQQKQTQNQLKLWDEPDPKLTPPKKLTRQQMRRDDYRPKKKNEFDRLDRLFGGWKQ